jgi:hypothetical protein
VSEKPIQTGSLCKILSHAISSRSSFLTTRDGVWAAHPLLNSSGGFHRLAVKTGKASPAFPVFFLAPEIEVRKLKSENPQGESETTELKN